MSKRMTRLVALLIFFGCCSFVGGSGCSVHRTNEGFVLGSHWSLECSERAPWVDFRNAADPANPDGEPSPATAASDGAAAASPPTSAAAAEPQAPAKPELLPWRSRLKAYRLAARGSAGKDAEAVSTVADDSPPEAAANSAASLPQPGQADSTPEAARPDPVIK
jgi:hypothetical protein